MLTSVSSCTNTEKYRISIYFYTKFNKRLTIISRKINNSIIFIINIKVNKFHHEFFPHHILLTKYPLIIVCKIIKDFTRKKVILPEVNLLRPYLRFNPLTLYISNCVRMSNQRMDCRFCSDVPYLAKIYTNDLVLFENQNQVLFQIKLTNLK